MKFLIPLVLLLGCTGSKAAEQEQLCPALADCVSNGALCMLVQVREDRFHSFSHSEAFGDMQAQFASLKAMRKDVHLVVTYHDLSRTLIGLKPSGRSRTVFVSAHGLALVDGELYVDDLAPVDKFFRTRQMPSIFEGVLRQAQVSIGAECKSTTANELGRAAHLRIALVYR